jgi:hypothetical protein
MEETEDSTWKVWSVNVGQRTATIVDEGGPAAAVESAGQRNMAAVRSAPGIVFMALGPGRTPDLREAHAILIERNGAAAARTDPDEMASAWAPVMMDLVELDEAGALRGIRAVITARLAMARHRTPGGLDEVAGKIEITVSGDDPRMLAEAAALMCAAIDRAGP